MAACNELSLLVSEAGITAAIGTYTRISAEDENGYSVWQKDAFSIRHGAPGNDFWFILDNGMPRYRTSGDGTDCPVGLTWELMPFGSPTPPAPTVITASQPSPVDIRNAKYATDTESGAHRFRRLVALGYV